jgi:hypothetical protein
VAVPGKKKLTGGGGRPPPTRCIAPCRRFAVGSPTCSTLRHSNEDERLSTGGKQLPQAAGSSSLWAAPQKQVTVALRPCRSGHVLM